MIFNEDQSAGFASAAEILLGYGGGGGPPAHSARYRLFWASTVPLAALPQTLQDRITDAGGS